MLTPPIDGKPATGANGGTIGFLLEIAEEAEAWHMAGVQNGDTSVEDPPGVRQGASGDLYLAYIRDPDGNKLCALHRISAWVHRDGEATTQLFEVLGGAPFLGTFSGVVDYFWPAPPGLLPAVGAPGTAVTPEFGVPLELPLSPVIVVAAELLAPGVIGVVVVPDAGGIVVLVCANAGT